MENDPNQIDVEILELCKQGKKLIAIKFYKDFSRTGLRESKDYVDKLVQENNVIIPKAKGGCFIATECYGDNDSLQVLILRRFRDEKLLKFTFGKLFVKFYYAISPSIAFIISKSKTLKMIVLKYFLEPIVSNLQQNY